jgi:uncharacterized membrane protein YdjX (TVP38/TMEM64 family)
MGGEDSATVATDRGPSRRRLVPVLAVAAVALAGYTLLGPYLTWEAVRDNRDWLIALRDRNYGLAVILYMLVYTGGVALSLPGGLMMTLAGGFLFGTLAAGTMTVVAATAGATILFSIARAGLGETLHARLIARAGPAGLIARLERGLRANEVSFLLVMRLVPAVPFFVANLAPAFLGVSLRNFVLTTFLGIIPGTFVFASVGAGLGAVFASGAEPDLGAIFRWPVLGPLLGLAALAALPAALRALRRDAAL